MCKPHKANGAKGGEAAQTRQELRGRLQEIEQKEVDWWYERFMMDA